MKTIETENAPATIGTYSQAAIHGSLCFLSGQIALDPASMTLVGGGFKKETIQVFDNLLAVCNAAGGTFDNIIKLTIYLTDLENFSSVNEIMASYFSKPYPARAAIEVSALPKGAMIEIEGIMITES